MFSMWNSCDWQTSRSEHGLSTCKELGLSDQLTALTNAASKGGGTASSAGAAENAQAGTASGASTSNQQKRLNS